MKYECIYEHIVICNMLHDIHMKFGWQPLYLDIAISGKLEPELRRSARFSFSSHSASISFDIPLIQ